MELLNNYEVQIKDLCKSYENHKVLYNFSMNFIKNKRVSRPHRDD